MSRKHYKEHYDVYEKLTDHFGESVTVIQLVDISNKIVEKMKPDLIPMTRDEKRSKELLIEWFSHHWDRIEQLIYQIVPVDEHGNQTANFGKKEKFLWKFMQDISFPQFYDEDDQENTFLQSDQFGQTSDLSDSNDFFFKYF